MYKYSNDLIPAPIVPIEISDPNVPESVYKGNALIDSGADTSCIPPSIVNEFKLIPIREEEVIGTTGQDTLSIYTVNILFQNVPFPSLSVIGLAEEDYVLIGRDILNQFHICLDGLRQVLRFMENGNNEENDKS